ncbi:MAG: metallophosphoesterase [Gammaproteobacteria bacterium]|nr:metallophosphoesterase [Gammaproteobacteria bacterium]
MVDPTSTLFQPLFDGPIDIVGDIHGEFAALQDLLRHLGYDAECRHGRRRLVFIGDLCDRGADSPATIAFVRALVEDGRAQCLLGNHELNLLRGVAKEGNGWFFAENHDVHEGKYRESRALAEAARAGVLAFIARLPLVLERADLRLVHAAWDDAAIQLLRDCSGPVIDIYKGYSNRVAGIVKESGMAARAAAEWESHGARLRDPQTRPPLLEHLGRLDALYQMANPIRILTSGPEALSAAPFFAAGKWRMLDRVRWWDRYLDEKPVMIGHYWRWPTDAIRSELTRGEHDLFAGLPLQCWHGARRNVYCLDFAVGARHKERQRGALTAFETRLGAVRWPERELVLDDGTRRALE